MNKRNLKTIHKKLSQWLEDLSGDADCNVDGLKGSDEPFTDLVDRASANIERSLSHNLCARESLLIEKIKRSLQDIAEGTYGICSHCGGDIAVERLNANPVAGCCIDCKTKIEAKKQLVEA